MKTDRSPNYFSNKCLNIYKLHFSETRFYFYRHVLSPFGLGYWFQTQVLKALSQLKGSILNLGFTNHTKEPGNTLKLSGKMFCVCIFVRWERRAFCQILGLGNTTSQLSPWPSEAAANHSLTVWGPNFPCDGKRGFQSSQGPWGQLAP